MQNIWQKYSGSIPLIFEIEYDGIAVSGLIPTVRIEKTKEGQYLDFNSGSFVSSGGVKYANMVEYIGVPGTYQYFFDPAQHETSISEGYYVIYNAIIPSGYLLNNSDIKVQESEFHYFIDTGGMNVSFD